MQQVVSDAMRRPRAEQCREALKNSASLLAMYVNRTNSAWAASRAASVAAPSLWGAPSQSEWAGSGDCQRWQQSLVSALHGGAIAVQLFALDDALQLPDGKSVDAWTCDPWDLAYYANPAQLRLRERLPGVPLGCRVLYNLVAAAAARAGRAAAQKLHVLLHLADDTVEQALLQLASFNYCGLLPSNIWVVVQRRRPAHSFMPSDRRFHMDASTARSCVGTGLAMMQLNWPGEALQLDDKGGLKLLPNTILENMEERGISWLLSQHGTDAGLLSADACFDPINVPFAMSAAKSGCAQAFTLAVLQMGLGNIHPLNGQPTRGSVVFRRTDGPPPRLAIDADSSLTTKALSTLSPVFELRGLEIHSGSAKATLAAGKLNDMEYAVGLDRYMFSTSYLRETLTSAEMFRPKLSSPNGHSLHVSLDAGDVLAAAPSPALCLQARATPRLLTCVDDYRDALVPLLVAQDAVKDFQVQVEKRVVVAPQPTGAMLLRPWLFRGQRDTAGAAGAESGAAARTQLLQRHGMIGGGGGGGGDEPGDSVGRGIPSESSRRVGTLHASSRRGENVTAEGGRLAEVAQGSGAAANVAAAPGSVSRGGGSPSDVRHVVVFVTSQSISAAAVDAAISIMKAGRDVLHLVTIVAGGHLEFGYQLLAPHANNAERAMVTTEQEVLCLSGEDTQLVATMDGFVRAIKADVVVLASQQLSAATLLNSAVLGSVTVACIKRFATPMLIVNATSAKTIPTSRSVQLKAMVLAQRAGATEMLRFLMQKVVQPLRGDALALATITAGGAAGGAAPREAEVAAARAHLQQTRLLAKMCQEAQMEGMPNPSMHQLRDDNELKALLVTENVHMLAYLLPSGQLSAVPEQLITLIHTAKAPVLVFKNSAE